ncbi:MAG: hypothetical protein HY554_02210 [Elusimicrobia bacterium]|nr:hypothetical protein [Elusimicrobiota bacterium]
MGHSRLLPVAALAAALGCGGFSLLSKQQAIVQPDLRLPRGTRIAVFPLTLYAYPKEERQAVSSAAYSGLTSALLKAGFRVLDRSLVDKAIDEYSRTKTFNKVAGPQGAVFQEDGEEVEKVIDVVDVGKTLASRLVAAGSIQLAGGWLASTVEVRVRITDVASGEMVSHCEASGPPSVIQGCADALSAELAAHMTGPAAAYKVNLE